jgi:nicotinate-nucleotide pyrophosphorylase (carboxylating)
MLDNMNLEDMRQAVQLIKGRALIEASGGINLERVRAVAETGVDLISIGALTHSPKALDISLELD